MKASWLNKDEYPFESKYFETAHGKMHYVDVGRGLPIVFVHGNSSWSFEYRHLIKKLSEKYRCIAMDHLGFGFSDKPRDFSYKPEAHSENLKMLIQFLGLNDISLYVGDWGGPIGLSYAVKHPDKVKNLIITNTWAWSVKNDWYYRLFSGFVGGKLGRYLIRKRNFFAKDIVKQCFGDKSILTQDIHNHYILPLKDVEDRQGNMVLPKEIINASAWLDFIWENLEVIADKNVLIPWGMKDIAFRKKEMETFIGAFPSAQVIRFEQAGHFLAEEVPIPLIGAIDKLVSEN